jgi:branched-chain amino acid transport system substrate-binding protein
MLRSGGLSPADPLSARRRGSTRLAAALAGVLALLALLGRSSDPASQAVAPDQPLQLGAALALTGNANLYGQDQRMGIGLARQWFDAKPHRRRVDFQLEDGASDEPSAIATFNLLIRRGVVALIGPTLSQQAFAADPIAQRQGVPVVAPSNTASGIPQIGSFISRVSAQSSVIAPLSIDEALRREPGTQRVAVFFAQDDAYSTAETTIFQKALAARGLKPVSLQRTQLADNDFQNPITAALQQKPQLIVISAICQRWCDGVLIAQAYSPELNTAINRTFRRLFAEANQGRIPGQIAAQAWSAYQVLFEAIQRLQARGGFEDVTLGEARQRLMAELLAGQYDTPLGPIHFKPDGEVVQGRFYVAEVRMDGNGRSGRFTLVREEAVQEGQP